MMHLASRVLSFLYFSELFYLLFLLSIFDKEFKKKIQATATEPTGIRFILEKHQMRLNLILKKLNVLAAVKLVLFVFAAANI